MNVKVLYKLKDMLCQEMSDIAEQGELNSGSLDVVYKAAKACKSLCFLIEEEESGDSYRGGDWEAKGSYGGNSMRGDSYRRGSSYDGGTSGRRHYVRGHMSYDDGVDEETRKWLETRMNEERDDETRNAYRMILEKM